MCVQTKNLAWERPAEESDIPFFEHYFPGINFSGMLQAMSIDGCVPLTTDLALFAGILSVKPDDLGVRFVPFAGIDPSEPQTIIKLTIMDHIVEWMENTALGGYMWQAASKWSEKEYGCKIEFSMNCGCVAVSCDSYTNGNWIEWVQRFNRSRKHTYGRTNIAWQDTIDGTDITLDQYHIWCRMRGALESLSKVEAYACTT